MPNNESLRLRKEIVEALKHKSNKKAKEVAAKFVPTSENVYGVRMPVLNELAKKYKQGGFELVEEIWKSGMFEERMLAAKLLGKVCKTDPDRTLASVRKFSNDITDWAICDCLGMQSTKSISKIKQTEIFSLARLLVKSRNFWQRRLALVLLEVYTKQQELHPDIRRVVKVVRNDKEYYVKKAVEWIERNMLKDC